MRVLLFLLLFNFVLTSDLLPTINITVTRGQNNIILTGIPQNCCVINYLEAFKIMVYKPKQIKKTIECFNAQNNNKILTNNLNEDSDGYYVIIQKATASMETEWQCKLQSFSAIFTHKFKVHVREKGLGIFYINNNNVISQRTEYTIPDYDEFVVHHYIDGEMTLFKCAKFNIKSKELKIMYQNRVTGEKLEVVDNKEAVLYLRLAKEHDHKYLDCIVTRNENDGVIFSTLRVFFKLKTSLDIPRFMINDMVLTPISQSNAEYDPNNPNGTFVYDYYKNEKVVVRTLTKNGSSLRCSNDKNPSQIVNDMHINTTLKIVNNNLKVICAVRDNQQQTDVVMTLKFKHVVSFDFYPMSGLSWANVLAKYKRNRDVVIKYSYRGDKLVLTCYAPDTGIRWDYKASEIRSEDISKGQSSISGEFWDSKWFQMKPNYNRTILKCFMDYRPGTEVELIREGTPQFEDLPETDIMKYFDSTENNNNISDTVTPNIKKDPESGNDVNNDVTVTPTSTSLDSISIPPKFNKLNIEDNTDEHEESFLKKNFRLLLICVTIVLATMVMTITVYLIMRRFKRRRKEQANLSNINYENLPEHNEGPMPMPKQWQCEDDDVTNSTPDVVESIDKLYAKPIPKALRLSKNTPIYAEAFDHANRPGADYVNTGRFVKRTANEGKDDDNYSEVYQCNKEVNSVNKIKYANIHQTNDTYAQVEPKTLQNDLKEHHYGNSNVTDDQSPNHYSEPAYADINS